MSNISVNNIENYIILNNQINNNNKINNSNNAINNSESTFRRSTRLKTVKKPNMTYSNWYFGYVRRKVQGRNPDFNVVVIFRNNQKLYGRIACEVCGEEFRGT